MKSRVIFAALTIAFLHAPHAIASESAAREVCRQFISKSGYSVSDWGQYWDWTTIDNRDGSWSVGARFDGMPPGGGRRALYVVCVAKKSGDNWKLESLSRMQ